MAKFKKGDRVRVKSVAGAYQEPYMDQVGTVDENESVVPWVLFNDGQLIAFGESCLERVPAEHQAAASAGHVVGELIGTAIKASHLPIDAAERKTYPVCTGCLDYFPNALAEVAKVSRAGNEQHHPGEPLHWDKSKSTDEADALVRHLLQRGTIDTDGQRHSAKVAWRALALLERELTEGKP